MKTLTILKTGDVPAPLADRFAPYPDMFARALEGAGAGFRYRTVAVNEGAPLPDPATLDAVLITGSAAGVYEDHAWLDPLRGFIRAAYGARTPMVGVCFGHQVIADALGGVVRKSEKGWGLGRHRYRLKGRPAALAPAMAGLPETLAIACSHQDQVIAPPEGAEVFLSSGFTPNAGLVYANGAVMSVQPHPEFEDSYARALVELRRGRAPEPVIATALASFETPSDSRLAAGLVAAFLMR
jgi:GMP synthase-like glutamine amidotransferase